MFQLLSHQAPRTPIPPALMTLRNTGRYQPVAPSVLAFGPILSNRGEEFRAMPAGCLGLFTTQNQSCGAEYGLHTITDLPRGLLIVDVNEDGQFDLVIPGATGPHRVLIRQVDGTYVNDASLAFAWPGEVQALLAADFDNDGHEELVVVTSDEVRLFRLPGMRREVCDLAPHPDAKVADINGDGRVELILGDRVYQAPNPNAMLRIVPKSRFGEPAYGATVRLHTTAREMLRLIDPGNGYGRRHEPVAHFGLGLEPQVHSAIITWPDGCKRTLTDLPLNCTLEVPYGE
jgi:hypothetical protein